MGCQKQTAWVGAFSISTTGCQSLSSKETASPCPGSPECIFHVPAGSCPRLNSPSTTARDCGGNCAATRSVSLTTTWPGAGRAAKNANNKGRTIARQKRAFEDEFIANESPAAL